jgi:hypothetical protein
MLRFPPVQLALSLTLVVVSATATRAATTSLDADWIKAGLRTTRLEEDGFVDRALRMVDEGKLSAELVQTTFIWARVQPQHPFQHFKRGLITRAPSSVRGELATGQPDEPSPPPSLGQRVGAWLHERFGFLSGILPSVRARIE